MARNTITDVREIVERINDSTDEVDLTIECWSTGTSKYRLIDRTTGKTFGPVCNGSTEFIKLLRGFDAGRRL